MMCSNGFLAVYFILFLSLENQKERDGVGVLHGKRGSVRVLQGKTGKLCDEVLPIRHPFLR